MFKKIIIRLILLAMMLALVAPLVLKKQDGVPTLTREDLESGDVEVILGRYKESLFDLVESFFDESKVEMVSPKGFGKSDSAEFYRWKDENGVWHFSDVKPDNVKSESLIVEGVNAIEVRKEE